MTKFSYQFIKEMISGSSTEIFSTSTFLFSTLPEFGDGKAGESEQIAIEAKQRNMQIIDCNIRLGYF